MMLRADLLHLPDLRLAPVAAAAGCCSAGQLPLQQPWRRWNRPHFDRCFPQPPFPLAEVEGWWSRCWSKKVAAAAPPAVAALVAAAVVGVSLTHPVVGFLLVV